MNWLSLESSEQLNEIVQKSASTPCMLLKFSPRCAISNLTREALESDWDFKPEEVHTYLLDVVAHPSLSRKSAELFEVHHESPQLLLIRDGLCTYDASHLGITVAELRECFEDTF